MSETRDDRTYYEQQYRSTAHTHTNVHVRKDTVVAVEVAYRDEDRVILQFGDGPAEISLFLHGADLERLHDVVHEALFELGHESLPPTRHEAYAAGWDAALAFVQTNTGEAVPNDAPAVPIGIG